MEGDWVNAGICVASALPVIGTAVAGVTKATKFAKAGSIIGKTLQIAGKTYATVQSATKALEMAGDAKLQYAANGGKMTLGVAAKIVGATAMAAISVATAGSLMKDVSSLVSDINSLSKVSDISLNTSSQKSADLESGRCAKGDGIGCFIAGTKVKTENGEKNIEDVESGDYVLAEDPETGEQEYKKVVRTYIHEKTMLVHVFVGKEEIKTTVEHPFYVEGIGFVSAGELRAGDIVRTSDGKNLPVDKVELEPLEEPVLVYNFEVEDFHTYYVSGLGVLVHNMCEVSQNAKGGTNSRYLKEGYTSGRRSSNLFGRDRSTRKTSMFTEWRRSIRKSDLANERRLFLGEDYVKVDKGKWRSLDGTRQFRLKPDDYIGAHPIGMPSANNVPHVHFEFLTPRSNGNGFDVVKNIHVPLIDD